VSDEASSKQSPVKEKAEPAPAAPAATREDASATSNGDTVLARVRARQAATAEPKLERVVVSPDQTGSEPASEDAPKRGGWWQRRLGG
jgi:hypothetical protein